MPFRIAAAKYHPDRFRSSIEKQKAHEIFVTITKNRDFLLDCINDPNFVKASVDATPLNLGYKDENGIMKIIIGAGTIIPCEVKS